MGGVFGANKTKYETVVKQYTELVNRAFFTTLQTCSSSSSASQRIEVEGSTDVTDMTQVATLQSVQTCQSKADVTTEMQNQLESAIKQEMRNKESGLGDVLSSIFRASDTESSASVDLRKTVENIFSNQVKQDIFNNLKVDQTIIIKDSQRTKAFTQTAIGAAVSRGLQGNATNLKMIDRIQDEADQLIKKEESKFWTYLIVGAVVLGGLYLYSRGGGGGSGSSVVVVGGGGGGGMGSRGGYGPPPPQYYYPPPSMQAPATAVSSSPVPMGGPSAVPVPIPSPAPQLRPTQ